MEVSAAQVKKIVEMLKKEEEMDALEAFISGLTPYPPPPPEKPPQPETILLPPGEAKDGSEKREGKPELSK